MTGIYIHIPFCIKKCTYCDFVSYEDLSLINPYLDALKTEIELSGALYKEEVDTVFLGGGTPSILDAKEINELLISLKSNFKLTKDAEITIESNPCTINIDKCNAYIEAGINRLSLGLQAADNAILSTLERIHTVEDFDTAYEYARTAGFKNINIDLIYGIPGLTTDQWKNTLYHTLYLKPEHISCYSLKVEEKTPLHEHIKAGRVPEKDEDEDADQYLTAIELLTEKGYINYEISNFAQFGRECKHNLKYWRLDNYLGLGIAAHSNIEKLRFSNTPSIKQYINQMQNKTLHYDASHFINDKERAFEYVMLKTRLKEGIDFNAFNDLFNVNFKEAFEDQIDKARYMGLCKVSKYTLKPTTKGFLYQNTLVNILTDNF